MANFKYPYKKDVMAHTAFYFEPGIYPARCYRVVFLGTHEKVYKNGSIGVFAPLIISWEIGRSKKDGGIEKKPWCIDQMFHYNTDPNSRLMAILQSWNGRYFTQEDVDNRLHHPFRYVGRHCRLVIGEQIIEGKGGMRRASHVQDAMVSDPAAKNLAYKKEKYWFSAATKQRDMVLFEKLPVWMQRKIISSKEWVRTDIEFSIDEMFDKFNL